MSVKEKLSVIHAERYAKEGLSLDQLTAATESIARHLDLDELELERRLDNVVRGVDKLGRGPANG